jgi:anti-anti-sigma regulatory factor
VTLKIETASDGQTATLRLHGSIQSESLDELQAQVRKHRPRLVLDLDEVTLVDTAVVRFLVACEAGGVELLNCAPYIREWISHGHGGRR